MIDLRLNKLYHSDNVAFMRSLPDDCIDLTVTSPPYDNLRNYNGHAKFDFENVAKELFRITKDGGVVVWIVNDATINGSETGTSFKQALYFKEIGFKLHDTMIWQKPFVPQSHKRYEQNFEFMFIFVKGKIDTFNAILKKNKKAGIIFNTKNYSEFKKDRYMAKDLKNWIVKEKGIKTNIWNIPSNQFATSKNKIAFEHPAIFPEKLAEDHIYSWSNEGDLVFDPFMGSGTVAVASERLKRNWIGCEICDEYVDIANRRIQSEREKVK